MQIIRKKGFNTPKFPSNLSPINANTQNETFSCSTLKMERNLHNVVAQITFLCFLCARSTWKKVEKGSSTLAVPLIVTNTPPRCRLCACLRLTHFYHHFLLLISSHLCFLASFERYREWNEEKNYEKKFFGWKFSHCVRQRIENADSMQINSPGKWFINFVACAQHRNSLFERNARVNWWNGQENTSFSWF